MIPCEISPVIIVIISLVPCAVNEGEKRNSPEMRSLFLYGTATVAVEATSPESANTISIFFEAP